LSRPAALELGLAERIGAAALAVAGPDACKEKPDLALRIAAAHMEVMRARRARAKILATARTDDTAIKRALDTHRYEARALAQRKFATRQFDDAFPAYGGRHYCSPSPAARVSRVQFAGSWRGDKILGAAAGEIERLRRRLELLGLQLHRAGRGPPPPGAVDCCMRAA
jgi:hypothetical protein